MNLIFVSNSWIICLLDFIFGESFEPLGGDLDVFSQMNVEDLARW